MRLRERPKRDYTVDITPLVDIVFLMLIFFHGVDQLQGGQQS